jgi:hypothetical protein
LGHEWHDAAVRAAAWPWFLERPQRRARFFDPDAGSRSTSGKRTRPSALANAANASSGRGGEHFAQRALDVVLRLARLWAERARGGEEVFDARVVQTYALG